MTAAVDESQRDQVESAFTPILRSLREQVSGVLAAVFVDTEGECIDYASRLEPYDAKVNAAHMLMMMDLLERTRDRVAFGEPFVLEIGADERELWVQRMGGEYVLVVVLTPDFDRGALKNALVSVVREFRNEVGLPAPGWESSERRLSVRVRASPGWRYAPDGWSDGDVRVTITDVLGRWIEASDVGEDRVCFRVRTGEGQELTLVHEPDGDGWQVRD